MTKKNTGMPTYYVLPRELTCSQRENFYHAMDRVMTLEQVFAIIGTPIPLCADVETVCYITPRRLDLIREQQARPTAAFASVGATPSCMGHGDIPLVRRTDMEAQVAVRDAEMHLLEEVLAFYVKDEDRYLKEEGEAYGSIPTDVGIKARSAASRFHAREQAAKHERGEA